MSRRLDLSAIAARVTKVVKQRSRIVSYGALFVALIFVAKPIVTQGEHRMDTSQWTNAIVNIQCAYDSVNMQQRTDLIRKLKNNEITWDEYVAQSSVGSRDIRSSGTALFMRHQEQRFLVTAMHVITHEQAICPILFRVDRADQPDSPLRRVHIMNMSAGPTFMRPFSFLAGIDLVVISFDGGDRQLRSFADTLEADGLKPISSDVIVDSAPQEGEDLLTVGFPVTVMTPRNNNAAEQNWRADSFSTPNIITGKAKRSAETATDFLFSMDARHGNSGGPVIDSKGKLVGVLYARTLDGSITAVKARFIHNLLSEQIARGKAVRGVGGVSSPQQ